MNLTNWNSMDPHLLAALLNTELRNQAEDWEDLVKTHDVDGEAILERLRAAGYEYRADLRQFR